MNKFLLKSLVSLAFSIPVGLFFAFAGEFLFHFNFSGVLLYVYNTFVIVLVHFLYNLSMFYWNIKHPVQEQKE